MIELKIGTRGSDLARFQANLVQQKLAEIGLDSKIVIIKTKGDAIQNRSLQSLGTGIFTKALDDALINGAIDIAVHSMKDVPTVLSPSLSEYAVLERGDDGDVLVGNDPSSQVVATGSIRRKAQWLRRHPNDVVTDLRGNVETRIEKVKRSEWKGGIFAKAGLVRLNRHLDLADSMDLDWMIPAPAQGAIVVIGRTEERVLQEQVYQLNHHESSLAVAIERTFLNTLEGGCAAPIGARAFVSGKRVKFVGCLTAPDGQSEIRLERESMEGAPELGAVWANELLNEGGREIMRLLQN
ncbi:MAG: hydroxymethylbilane synthase [Crocinitomicaceae bacterium]|nr:hydroxymethylbilane synthase [Crocinitomicaceae bacterium]